MMAGGEGPRHLLFEPFRLDRKDERLWRGAREVPLGRKAFGVLRTLADRAGELVTKEELFDAVWPETAVSDAVLTTAVRELRRSLGDDARKARFIATVHGRGYRFVARVEGRSAIADRARTSGPAAPISLVGRETERTMLREALAAVVGGTRRIVFVAGEPGIGKTALVDAFASEAAGQHATIARGQCVETYGAGEPYLPLLEALARLGREGERPDLTTVLRTHAPSWLPHLPSLAPERPPAAPAPAAATQMLRELADAFDVLTETRPLVLVLEDLHWSDAATLGWIDAVARRRDPARFLLLATYRPVEAIVRGGSLRRLVGELRRQPPVVELALDYLSRDAVHDYLGGRFGTTPLLDAIADVLHERSHGLPLFLVTIVEELQRSGILGRDDVRPDLAAIAGVVPASVRQSIEQQVDGLAEEDRRILEAASVIGTAFPVAAVAAAASFPEEAVESRCATRFRDTAILREAGAESWPDGTLTTVYRFPHDLWRDVVHRGLPAGRKARLHRDVARRLESAWGERSTDIAAALAVHFEEGHETERAVRYRREAAATAVRRSAYPEALAHLEHGLALVEALGPTREHEELGLTLELGAVRAASEGWATAVVAETYARARALSRSAADPDLELRAIWGQLAVSLVRADYAKGREQSTELLELAGHQGDRFFRMAGRFELAGTDLLVGRLAPARSGFEDAITLYETGDHPAHLARFGVDLGVFALAWSSHLFWLLGETAVARTRSEEAIRRSDALAHPFTRAIALSYAAMLAQLEQDAPRAGALAETASALCERYGFPYYTAWARIFRGWASGRGGIADIRQGIDSLERSGARRSRPYHQMILAEALLRTGERRAAARALDVGLAVLAETGERWCEDELLRVKRELRKNRSA